MRFTSIMWILAAVLVSHESFAQQKPSAAVAPNVKTTETSAVHRYTPEDVVGVAAIQPARILKAKYVQMMIEAASGQQDLDQAMVDVTKQLDMDPRTILEAALLFDRETIDRTLNPMGGNAASDVKRKNNLKQFGLAMHNMHDTYNCFPDDDGLNDDNKGNLSWRVYMLPYLDQGPLYNQFHLDEPWDSDHNKTLIEEMPAIFETPGVKEKGKTSVHLFTGPGSPFAGKKGPQIRDITDGTSNTIMTVMAGADKAQFWTKPGGLDFDPAEPIKAFGKIDEQFLVGMMDGSVRSLSAGIDKDILKSIITHAGGEVVNYAALEGTRRARVQSMPGIMLRTTTPLDHETIFNVTLSGLGEGEPGKIGSQVVTVFESCMVAMPDDHTLLIGPEPLLKKMLAPRESGRATDTIQQQLFSSFPANDIAGMIDFEQLKDLKAQAAQNSPFPGLIEGLEAVKFTTDIAGDSQNLSLIEVRTDNKAAAQQLSALAQGLLQMQKAQMLGMANTPGSSFSPELAETLAGLYDTVKITAKDNTVTCVMPKPEKMGEFVESMKPGVVSLFEAIRSARKAAVRTSRKNNMKQIGLAFHNYHDVFNHFPAENGNGERGRSQKNGLSWRVHLLPFFEEAELYSQFKMDEDWDSPHNKALIEQMPAIFKTEGVEKPGYTSVHVFTGADTAMGTDNGTGIRDIIDGTSNTILAVVAGSDKAEIWTKPGGFAFNADDPKKVLGKLGDVFLALLCDGSVRFVNSDIDDDMLRNLIQRNDGKVIGEF